MRSDELPQVMSLEVLTAGAEDSKFENVNKSGGVDSERSETYQNSVARCSSLLGANYSRLH